MEQSLFFIDANGNINGKFDEHKYNKLSWINKLRFKFNYNQLIKINHEIVKEIKNRCSNLGNSTKDVK